MNVRPARSIDVAEILKTSKTITPEGGWNLARAFCPTFAWDPEYASSDCSKPLKDSVPLPPAHYFGEYRSTAAACHND